MSMRYPIIPCSPGLRPVVIDVRAVTVVVGATVVTLEPSPELSVGAKSRRSSSWCQPRPSSTSNTTWCAPCTTFGIQLGMTSGDVGPSSAGTMFAVHAPE